MKQKIVAGIVIPSMVIVGILSATSPRSNFGQTVIGWVSYWGYALEQSKIGSLLDLNIKNDCLNWKYEMTIHNRRNPILTGNYEVADDVFKKWTIRSDGINKKLFDALGIKYYARNTEFMPHHFSLNHKGMIEAAQRCYNAGVDFGGMKELNNFSKGFE